MNETIRSHAYPNGLVLVAEPMTSVQSAAFTFYVPAGSVRDPADRSGLAGFTCEMTLRGAGERDNRQFVLDLDNLGVERSESVTGAHTGFGGAMLAENLPAVLAIFADLLRRPLLPAEELEAGRLTMMQELRAVEDEPAQKLMTELRRRHYGDPWGRPAQGEMEAVEAIAIDDIRDHFAKHYRPNGTILGVAGDLDWEQLKDTVDRLLGDWQPKDAAEVTEREPDHRYEHFLYDSNQTHIGIAYPNVPYRDPNYFQAWGAAGVLGSGSSSRLFTEVRERRGLCYGVHASCHTLHHRGAVLCYAGTSAERAQETLDVTMAELRRLAEGIEADELDRLKSRIKAALIMQQESSSARSSSIAREWYHIGRVRTLDELGQIIDALTHESINAYLAEHPPGDFTLITLGPCELEVPGGVL